MDDTRTPKPIMPPGPHELDGDCPICLDPLPAFWLAAERATMSCCGKQVCAGCHQNWNQVIQEARDDGRLTGAVKQLASHCSMCRAKVPSSIAEDNEILKRNADKGHAWAQWSLAAAYEKMKDYSQAIILYQKAANQGHPNAQHYLGIHYWQGTCGLTQSHTEAKRWFTAAAKQGHAPACYNLSIGALNEGNYTEHIRLTTTSAFHGVPGAQHHLGLLYLGRYGHEKSLDKAVHYFTLAAKQGNSFSMYSLGLVFVRDATVPFWINPEFSKGARWFLRAAAAGCEDGKNAHEKLVNSRRNVCFGCQRLAEASENFMRCTRCRAAWFCGKKCQRRHWKAGHKNYCCVHDEPLEPTSSENC